MAYMTKFSVYAEPLLTRRYWQVSRVNPDGHLDWNHYIDFKTKERAMNYIMANINGIVSKGYTHWHYSFVDNDGYTWHLVYNN